MPKIIGTLFAKVLIKPKRTKSVRRKRGIKMKVKLLPLTRLFLFQCLLTMIVAMPFSNANAQGRGNGGHGGGGQHGGGHQGGGQPGPGPSYPSPTNPYGFELNAQVNAYLYSGQLLGLNQPLGLQQVLSSGRDLVAISVKAQATQYGSRLILLLNGRQIDTKPIGDYAQDTDFRVPNLQRQDQLAIQVQGGAFIASVSGQLSRGPIGPGPGGDPDRIRAVINQHISAPTTLPVRQIIHQATGINLVGLKVDKVIMKASSARGFAQAQLLINGQPVGMSQTIPVMESRLVFDLPNYNRNIIGQDLNTIQIQVNGRSVDVKMIALKLDDRNTGMDNVQINVNQRFQGDQRVALSQLLGYNPRVDVNAPIEAITITASGRGNIMVAGAGMGQGGISVMGPTTQSLQIMGYQTSAQDLKLRISGSLVIESIRIKFKSVYY
jgi:hypothetical protein